MKNESAGPARVTRRDFLLLSAGAALAAGCQAVPTGTVAPTGPRTVDAGPAAAYQADAVYPAFRNEGFFLIRRGGALLALSALCTHRHCRLDAESDRTFSCPCHGSEFDADGHVTAGPATQDLPLLATSTDARGHLLVHVPGV